MELFAAARLEITERARFVSLVSSFEPLALPKDYPKGVSEMVKAFRNHLSDFSLPELSPQEASQIKKSLDGRLRALQKESIRQALLRTVRQLLPNDEEAVEVVDTAYDLRSKILHEGVTDPYIGTKTHAVESVLRRMFSARIGKPLKTPVREES
jgi:hypothetical protein